MRSERRRALAVITAVGWAALAITVLAQTPASPRFRPDDPLWRDDDRRHDVRGFRELELSETYDLLVNTLTHPGDRRAVPAVNVNTLDEVPDSSWFVNRIGQRRLDESELVRGPHKFETAAALEWDDWEVTRGKGPGGFHPGFRAERPGDPGQTYQLEVDPVGFPRLATGAEIVGTLIYHALGYHTQDVYPVRVHPSKITISPRATVRDASGQRPFRRRDLDGILQNAARDSEGRVYFSATRFEEGEDVGQFEYYGTRPDDPNDIHPHEHRRELRANRVFAAWLAHDDSRALNTRNLRKRVEGRRFIEHHMYDFGATLGSATRFPDNPISGYAYYLEGRGSLVALFTLGLRVPPPLGTPVARDTPAGAGTFESTRFTPERWRANYPNAAFDNMQPADAFWGARLVSRFRDADLHAIVSAADYADRATTDYLAATLARRRDAIARTWLTALNPVADVTLAADGTLRFVNAAVEAQVATPATYAVAWARYDNTTGVATPVATTSASATNAAAPDGLLASAAFVQVSITSRHPDFPAWATPVRVWFRKDGAAWTTVGLTR